MEQTFTTNDLVRFLYHECSTEEEQLLAVALESDASFNKEFRQLQGTYRFLSELSFAPSRNSVQNILEYNSRTALEAQF